MIEEYLPTDWSSGKSIIKVIGVGGGGGNAVNQMFKQGIKDVDFLICNTDKQALKASPITEKIQLGNDVTRGLGAGCNPEKGRKAAMESIEEIRRSLEGGTEMVFITAGMGGGTGTGAAPIIAQEAKKMGLLTVGVVTLPFRDEGSEFLKRAVLGIKELEKHVDSLLIIDNQKLYQMFGDLSIFEAFPKADSVLSTAVKGIAEIITRPGFINVDFADVRMVMENSGMAIMGTGKARGENRANIAVQEAFNYPLLNDFDLRSAQNVLVSITSSNSGHGLRMDELSQIMDYITEYTGGNASKFKRGVVFDPDIGDEIQITIVATGFDMTMLPQVYGQDGEIAQTHIIGEDTTKRVISSLPKKEETEKITIITVEPKIEECVGLESKGSTQEGSKGKGRPVLIIRDGDNIERYEKEPAYLRKNLKISHQEHHNTQKESRESSTFRIEENKGKQQLLSDNSYIHQNQD